MGIKYDSCVITSNSGRVYGKPMVRDRVVFPASVNVGYIIFSVSEVIRESDVYGAIYRCCFRGFVVIGKCRFAPRFSYRIKIEIGIAIAVAITRMGQMCNSEKNLLNIGREG